LNILKIVKQVRIYSLFKILINPNSYMHLENEEVVLPNAAEDSDLKLENLETVISYFLLNKEAYSNISIM
jgi:hypothetical protein